MLSKNQIKLISALHQKKHRIVNNMFFAEGVKTIQELINSSYKLEYLFTTQNDFMDVLENQRYFITDGELKKISALTNPNSCLAVFRIPPQEKNTIVQNGLILALDDIRDPGNLGTIIRICDWFGITQLVCSQECTDAYNPKVVQASMGSIARVKVSYLNLNDFLTQTNMPIFGTFMDGENIYETKLPQEAIIVMGNEANGISPETEAIVKQKISIPRFGNIQKTESLNVAIATALVISEFRKINY